MRKKGCLLLAALALLLVGCGEKTQKSAEDLQARYAQMQGYEAIVETAVPREDETLYYTLSLEHSNGETRAAVLAPEELTGVGAVLEGDKLTLTFDDLVLDVGTLSPRVSALSCVPLVLQNFPKVYLDSSGAETLGDVDTLRADFSLTLSGETLACGSGACAALVAANLCGLAGREAEIELDGGTLLDRWDEQTGRGLMTGPAAFVFDGEYEA